MTNPHNLRLHITREEINSLPLRAFEGEIVVVADKGSIAGAFDEIRGHEVVGFDTESRPTFRKGQQHPVALIQVALPRKAFLIRVNRTGITAEINHFLQDHHIKKAGVALHDDLRALQRLTAFEPAGFIDLSVWARQHGLQVEGVKRLTGLLLGFRISKSAQTSNWEALHLTEKQRLYAATDAWVCLELYLKMVKSFS